MTSIRENASEAGRKVALVTGGASGLGEAIARRLANDGCMVVVTDIDTGAGMAVAEALGGRFFRHNVASEADWAQVIDAIRMDFGRLDILVNNAGITLIGSIEDLSVDAFQRTLDVDLLGVFLGCKAGIALMKERGGAIVNISSVAGLRASATLVGYNAAKAGVTLMTKSIALHCATAGYRIRCNSVHPGVIKTPMLDKVMAQVEDPEAMMAGFISRHPIGHLGEPADVADMVAFLAGDHAKFVTGAEFVVDGGTLL
jgi:NAD(P)-dependent dehydrogenase (short-subunit alcohol dehydrogenase family)